MSITSAFNDIEKLETDLWEAADNLRANSKLTSSEPPSSLAPLGRRRARAEGRMIVRFSWPTEIQEKVLANWQRYGFQAQG